MKRLWTLALLSLWATLVVPGCDDAANTDDDTSACDDGFVEEGSGCVDIDECSEALHDCDANASCTNTSGSFDCSCNEGYDGDGRVCTELCVEERHATGQLPAALHILLDRSGSMSSEVGGGTLWSAVTSSIADFLFAPQAVTGDSVGIEYFPKDPGYSCPPSPFCYIDSDCGPCGPCYGAVPNLQPGLCLNEGACQSTLYADPAVPLSPLPGVAAAIASSMDSQSPAGGTPTSVALEGALDYAMGWAGSHPDTAAAVIMVTDGEPTDCDTNPATLTAVVGAATDNVPRVYTAVVGLGTTLSSLDPVAAAGGTEQVVLVDTSQDLEGQTLSAFEFARHKVAGHFYGIPPEVDDPVHLPLVELEFTPSPGAPAERIPWLPMADNCAVGLAGWHYDDPADPSRIVLCPHSSDRVAAAVDGTLECVIPCP